MTFAILVVFGGYTVASYGWILLQGYDITFKQWIDPLHPLTTWPAKGSVTAGSVFPTGAAATTSAAGLA
jgi:hypothetical protein